MPGYSGLSSPAPSVRAARGRVVYATCTYAPEENEAVVDAVLNEADGRARLVATDIPGLRTLPGLTEWGGVTYDASLVRAHRIWPHLNDTGGFFVAVLEVEDHG